MTMLCSQDLYLTTLLFSQGLFLTMLCSRGLYLAAVLFLDRVFM